MNRKYKRFVIILIPLILGLLACNIPGIVPNEPTVEIQSPDNRAEIPVDEPVILSVVATDAEGPGVARLELFVDGDSIKSLDAPGTPEDIFDAAITWIPDDEGETELTIIAYREDDTPSEPASITVIVVGASAAS